MLMAIALGTLMGSCALDLFSTLPQFADMVFICASVLLLAAASLLANKQKIFAKHFSKRPFLQLSVALIGVCSGFCWTYFCAQQKLAWQLPDSDILKKVAVCGTVTGVTRRFENTFALVLSLNQYEGKTLSEKGLKIRLYGSHNVPFADGDKLCAMVKLKPRWHLSNPGGQDEEKHLFIEGIAATGKIQSINHYQASSSFSIHRLRQKLSDRLSEILKDKPYLGVIQATTLGIYHHITPEQWEIFKATGTVHAIAISGMHISFVALLCGGWVTWLARRYPSLTNRMPAKCYGAIFSLVGALLYSALAGFSIPTQRALIMILVTIFSLLKRQPLLSLHALALAWCGIFIVDPLAVLQVGFWLSFACVAVLIFGSSHTKGGTWRKWIIPQWIVFIGLIPWVLCIFHQIPLLSPLANMLVLPAIDIVVVPASLLGLLLSCLSKPLAFIVLSCAEYLLECLGWILTQFTRLSFNVWQQGEVPWFYVLLGALATLSLLAPRGLPGRQWAWLGFLPMFFYQGPRPIHGECKVTLLDVGQGLSAVIQTKQHTLLYDAGPRYGKNDDAANRVIKPFFINQHLKKIDKVIISHGDLDHRGGLDSLENFPITEVLSSEPHRLKRFSRPCIGTEQWEWDGVTFTLLNPLPGEKKVYKKRNNISCVLKVTAGRHSVLLTGDIEKEAEQLLVKTFGPALASSILVVPHHGSLTSSSWEFIETVHPQFALYPVGLANQYGFPRQAIVERYNALNVKNLLVSHTGALIFHLKPAQDLTPPIRWRDTVRRYWHRSAPDVIR